MCRNVWLAAVLCLFVVGCGPTSPVDSCQVDGDCDGILICVSGVCVVPERDAGVVAPRDAGTSSAVDAGAEDAGTSSEDAGVADDAGVTVDAGVMDDAGVVDAGTCVPSLELCNGLDDDCDGLVDDMALVSALDAGVIELDGGAALNNGMCTMGLGACANTGVTSCAAGALSCNAMPGMPGVERCNTLDDDCDGQTDENDPGICAITGQVCSGGACACPSGQSVCNGMCKVLTAEVCDGLDNDCNGQIDEGVTITCLADGDNDGYATDATTSQQCSDSSRAAFGNCPSGYVAPSSSPAIDCNATDGSKYRRVSSQDDADGDSYCLTLGIANDCVGTSALPGRRFAADCNAFADCDDSTSSKFQVLMVRTDADGDSYCAPGGAFLECSGASPNPGRRLSGCAATDDCNDNDATAFRTAMLRADADRDLHCTGATENRCIGSAPPTNMQYAASCVGPDDCNDAQAASYQNLLVRNDGDSDGRCVGSAYNACTGASPPAGTRLSAACIAGSDDCADNDMNLYRLISIRNDADNDNYCSGASVTTCIGANAPAGKKIATSCAGDDCKDSNGYATTTCSIPAGYTTTSATKQCGVGHAPSVTANVSPNQNCPAGFTYIYGLSSTTVSYSGNSGGACTVNSPTNLTLSCSSLVFGSFTCSIAGSCEAN